MRSAAFISLVVAATVAPLGAQETRAPSCESDERYHQLDFWIGDWDVYVGEAKVGENRIEKILEGCAIIEHWRSASGSAGKSLFYYWPAEERWKQVWVTSRAPTVGGTKEKALIEVLDGGGLRFQGEIRTGDGGSYLDRTTLTPLPGGVRQLIEHSIDSGRSWTPSFDAIYRPAEALEPPS